MHHPEQSNDSHPRGVGHRTPRPRRAHQPGATHDGVPGAWRLLGWSRAIRSLLQEIEQVGPSEATVLIRGERGTGKELGAEAIVAASRRRDRPLVKLNCAALPTELLASELFGHERGAFTGAVDRRRGLLAAADGGTVFLDEIGDLSRQGQAMLLRFLQEREVRPVGATQVVRVDVRVIAATNRDLEAAVERGEFRADLHDRLREVVLAVPPLRERREDVVPLAEHFIAVQAERHRVRPPRLTPDARTTLVSCDWPGNVRELEHAMSRGVIRAKGERILASHLGLRSEHVETTRTVAHTLATMCSDLAGKLTLRQRTILRIAGTGGGVQSGELAALLGISVAASRRELRALTAAGALRRTGAGRLIRYQLRK